MNDQAILEQLARKPGSRAVQLADRLDVDLEDVQGSLAGLIAVGDVVAMPGTSPAGNACQFYDLSAQFKASTAYKPIAVTAMAAEFGTKHAELGKTERALAFVLERGTASSFELHTVMGLKPHEHASTYLACAISDQRLIREGKDWTPGPSVRRQALAQAAAAPQPALASGEGLKPVSVPKFMAAQAPTKQPGKQRTARHVEAPAAPAPTAAAPVYRCALWSDGVLEIRCDGETVAEIPKAAGESIATFLRRLAGEGTPA